MKDDSSTSLKPDFAAKPASRGSASADGASGADSASGDGRQGACPAPTDSELIDATLAGDATAFGGLVQRYQDRVYNTLVRFTGSTHDAQDITQDAFVQALVKLDSFKRTSSFFTWLYRIAFNLAVSQSRKRRPRASLDGLQDSSGAETEAPDDPPDQPMLTQERITLVRAAIAELANDHRQVVVLRELEGFDYCHIAEILDVPVGTVRSRLFRARLQLRERLTPEFGDDPPCHTAGGG